MGTLNEDLTEIKKVEDTIIANKVARFAYTDEAYTKNDANGVIKYNVNKAQNIPTADPSVLKVNDTVLSQGYRAQASSITRMLMNHFLGRLSYNVNKVNDGFSNLVATLIKHRGTANGFATLDENGRIPYSQLPESAAGDVKTVNNISPENGNIPLTGENIPVSSTDPTLLSAPLTTDRYANSSVTTEKIADNAVTNAKIKDPVSVAKGGTGQTTLRNACNSFINALDTSTTTPQDDDFYVSQYVGGGTTNTSYIRRNMSALWTYIKSKNSFEIKFDSNHSRYVKIGSILISQGTVRYANLVLGIFANSKPADFPIGFVNINISSGNCATGFSINGFSSIPLNLTGTHNPRIIVNKTDKDYELYVDCSYAYLRVVVYENATSDFTRGNFETYDSLSGTEVFNSTTSDNIVYLDGTATYATNATNAYNAYRGMVHTCSTASGTKAKTVSVTGFTLATGACIRVLFTNGNNIANPTLNVNNTGAKEIRVKQGSEYVTLSAENGALRQGSYGWQKNTLLELYYNGSYWVANENAIVHEKLNSELGYLSSRVFINGRKEIWGGTSPYDITANESKVMTISSDLPINDDISNHSLSVITEIESTYVNAYGDIKLMDNTLKFSIYSRNLTNNSYRVKTVHIFVTGY